MEKVVLTGEVAGEEKHQREDDQECDVRLQDSCESLKTKRLDKRES